MPDCIPHLAGQKAFWCNAETGGAEGCEAV